MPDGLDGAGVLAGLIGYWRLDDAPGSGVARDSSGRGHHATLEGPIDRVAGWVPGYAGRGLRLPRDQSSVGLLVGLPEDVRTLRRFTIAVWTYRDSLDDNRNMSVMSRRLEATGTREVFNLGFDGDEIVFYMQPNPTAAGLELRFDIPSPLNRWHHIAVTLDGQRAALYWDGVERQAATWTAPPAASQQPLYIGTNKDALYDQPFDGVLDEVLLYSEALDQRAITAIRNGMTPALP
jgi:hypothetical protein